MSGFRKAKAQQAFIKMALYGPPGSGKTLTALLLAEGLANRMGKRIAYIDTERGTDFYSQAVPDRAVHPAEFDFDALYSRSLTEIAKAVYELDPARYGVVVVDSISHLWTAAIAAYEGRKTSIGSIPLQAWGKVKKPYKDLEAFLLSAPMHWIDCGRMANEFGEDDQGELKKIGVKMRAEGETAYEPHILIRMEAIRERNGGPAVIQAYVEKDRTGVLNGKVIPWPNFNNVIKPLLGLLGDTQASMPTSDAAALQDAETMAIQDAEREKISQEWFHYFAGKLQSAATQGVAEVEAVSKEITPEVKKAMLNTDVIALREKYSEALERAKSKPARQQPPRPPTATDKPPAVQVYEKMKADIATVTTPLAAQVVGSTIVANYEALGEENATELQILLSEKLKSLPTEEVKEPKRRKKAEPEPAVA